MGRPRAEQAVEARVLLKPAPELEKLDVQPVRLGIGNAVRSVLVAHHAQQTDQAARARRGTARTRPGARSALPPAWMMSVIVPAGLPGQRFRRRMKRGRHVGGVVAPGGSVGVTGQPDDRLRGVAGERFPGLIDPGQSELRVEPEGRLARLLPELRGLENRPGRG